MTIRTTGLLATFAALGVGLAACTAPSTPDDVESSESSFTETPGPRKGSTIDSPSVSKSKTYWGVRDLDQLEKVLTTDATRPLLELARRADGVLASSPSNGRVGVDELAALEKQKSLLPEERARVVALWKLLEMGPATQVAVPKTFPGMTIDGSYSLSKTQMPFDPATSELGRRIQQVHDSDGDPATLSGEDLEKAYAYKEGFTAAEIDGMWSLAIDVAGGWNGTSRLAADAQHVELAGKPNEALFTDKYLEIGTNAEVSFGGNWQLAGADEPVILTVTRSVYVGFANMTLLARPEIPVPLVIEYSGREHDVAAGGHQYVSGTSRVELWLAGERIGEYDVVFDPNEMPSHSEPIPFGFVVKHDTSTHSIGFSEGYGGYDVHGRPPLVPTGGYYVVGKAGARLDVFASGRAIYRTSSGKQDCYPTVLRSSNSANNLHGVGGCRVMNAAGQAIAQFTYLPDRASGDSPALIRGTIGEVEVELYPH